MERMQLSNVKEEVLIPIAIKEKLRKMSIVQQLKCFKLEYFHETTVWIDQKIGGEAFEKSHRKPASVGT